MRECRTPRDWSLLALQNIRTGKSHYLVICKCPDAYNLGKFERDSFSFERTKLTIHAEQSNFLNEFPSF